MQQPCDHLKKAGNIAARTTGCEECQATGGKWVELRKCLECGHVGCCDSSDNKHATKHFEETKHPVMQSFQPGATWRWCYVDEIYVK